MSDSCWPGEFLFFSCDNFRLYLVLIFSAQPFWDRKLSYSSSVNSGCVQTFLQKFLPWCILPPAGGKEKTQLLETLTISLWSIWDYSKQVNYSVKKRMWNKNVFVFPSGSTKEELTEPPQPCEAAELVLRAQSRKSIGEFVSRRRCHRVANDLIGIRLLVGFQVKWRLKVTRKTTTMTTVKKARWMRCVCRWSCTPMPSFEIHLLLFEETAFGLFRAQQAARPLPQKKCPTWSFTSSLSSFTALRLLKVPETRRKSTPEVLHVLLSSSVFAEINRSYQMSSFVETKALEQLTKCPVEFVEYPSELVWSFWVPLLIQMWPSPLTSPAQIQQAAAQQDLPERHPGGFIQLQPSALLECRLSAGGAELPDRWWGGGGGGEGNYFLTTIWCTK